MQIAFGIEQQIPCVYKWNV